MKNVRIPGFRPGKAPRRIFEAQYGSAAIQERAMDAIVPGAYSRALAENDLDPIDQPQMELLPNEEGQPLRFRATVFVRPQFEPHDYEGIPLVGSPTAVSDADVTTALASLRKEAASLAPVDRPVALGDVPTIDFLGTIDGVPFDGGAAENQPTEILEERFIPGFASGIVGMSAGERRDVNATFPAEYGNADLAGKTATFVVTVHENKVAELPALDDELAKRFGGEEATLDTLRDEMRNRLEANARERQRRELTGTLLAALADKHEIALPAVLVDRESDGLLAEARQYVERAGLTWPDYLAKNEKSEDALRAEYRPEAERRVKTGLLVEAIAKARSITATEADIEAEIAQLSKQYGQPREAILEMLRANFNALVDGIVRTKTVEWLLDRAVITEREPEAASEAVVSGDAAPKDESAA